MLELLTVQEMAEADRRTIAGGIPGFTLMQAAGRRVFEVVRQRWTSRPVLVICGPGNNGGDGYVIAKDLADDGWPVQVASTVPVKQLSGDALRAADSCGLSISPAELIDWTQPKLIVDAIFGAGLCRPITDKMATLIQKLNQCRCPVVAVDMPSGVDGNTGELRGVAVKADHTVTFFRAKPGHYLHPGRELSGELHVRDIGIMSSEMEIIKPYTFLNGFELWGSAFPWPDSKSHKYKRGSAFVCSGGANESGAARLAALAALRCGAGLVTMLSPKDALYVNANHLTEVMLKQADTADDIEILMSDPRVTSALIGPGIGSGAGTCKKVLSILRCAAKIVLDADALTSFENDQEKLFAALRPSDVLTPHEGEFARLFDGARSPGDKVSSVKQAAKMAGCVVLLKGDDTVIAEPNGSVAINANGSEWLATAGSGDVLAGLITGLIAQGMPSFEAAGAAVWLHAEAGRISGPGTIAGDLIEKIPMVIGELKNSF